MPEDFDTDYAKLVREQLKNLIEAGRITVDHKGVVRMTEAVMSDMLERKSCVEKSPTG